MGIGMAKGGIIITMAITIIIVGAGVAHAIMMIVRERAVGSVYRL